MSESSWLKEVLERNKEEIASWPSWAKEDSSPGKTNTSTHPSSSTATVTQQAQQAELGLEQIS